MPLTTRIPCNQRDKGNFIEIAASNPLTHSSWTSDAIGLISVTCRMWLFTYCRYFRNRLKVLVDSPSHSLTNEHSSRVSKAEGEGEVHWDTRGCAYRDKSLPRISTVKSFARTGNARKFSFGRVLLHYVTKSWLIVVFICTQTFSVPTSSWQGPQFRLS